MPSYGEQPHCMAVSDLKSTGVWEKCDRCRGKRGQIWVWDANEGFWQRQYNHCPPQVLHHVKYTGLGDKEEQRPGSSVQCHTGTTSFINTSNETEPPLGGEISPACSLAAAWPCDAHNQKQPLPAANEFHTAPPSRQIAFIDRIGRWDIALPLFDVSYVSLPKGLWPEQPGGAADTSAHGH